MLDEQLEFRITQYLDGALPPEACAALLEELAHNEAGREALEDYRKLAGALGSVPALPEVNWDRLQQQISSAVAASVPLSDEVRIGGGRHWRAAAHAPEASYRMPWLRMGGWLAMAACVAIAVGVAFELTRDSTAPRPAGVGMGTAVATVHVSGPEIEVASGPSVQEVSIGPPPALAQGSGSNLYDEGILSAPAQLVIASGPDAVQDIDSLY